MLGRDPIRERLRRREASNAAEPEPEDPGEEFAWFFREEFPPVTRTVSLILRDRHRAEEIAQEAFIQLLRHWKKVSRYEMPDAWVRRVAIRLAVRAARREAARGALERRAPVPAFTPPAAADPGLIEAVGRLPAAQRAAVVLFYYEDRPVAQVADLLDCSTSTAKVHLHRARARLRDLLGEEVTDEP